MLKEDIERLIQSKDENFMITYPSLFLQYIAETKEENKEAIYSEIEQWERSIEDWFKDNYRSYFRWERAVEKNPELAKDYQDYIKILMENAPIQTASRVFERFHEVKVPLFGFSQEKWEEITLLSEYPRMVTTYLRCCSPKKEEYDVELLYEVIRKNPYQHIHEWCDLLIKFIKLKDLLEQRKDVEEVLQEICKFPTFDAEKVRYYIPLATVQMELVNMLCARGEIKKAVYIVKTIGDKNVYHYDARRKMSGHLNIKVKESYVRNIQPMLLNKKASLTDQELHDLIFLYMNSGLRVRIDIMDVARYVSENQGKKLYKFFENYQFDGRISYIDKMGDTLLVEPYLFSAFSRGKIHKVSKGTGKYEQKMLNADIAWVKKNLRKLDYAHLDDSCTFYLSDMKNGRLFVKDIVVCDRDDDGKLRFREMSEDKQNERRESFIREVLEWIDNEVMSKRHYIWYFEYHEKRVKQKIEALGQEYRGKHSARCTQPETLSNYDLREELAVGIVHALARAIPEKALKLFVEIQGGGFLRGANECRYVANEFLTSKLFSVRDESKRKQLIEDATYLFLREGISTDNKLKIYFNTILKHVIPIEELPMYGNERFKEELNKYLGRYWISVFAGKKGLKIPENKAEASHIRAPYNTKYELVYVNGDIPFQGKGYGRIGEIDRQKRQLQIRDMKTKEELKDQFADFYRLLLDFKNMDDFDKAYQWFEEATANYTRIEIKEGFSRHIRNITNTLDEIFREMAKGDVEQCGYLLKYMDFIGNNPFTWEDYQERMQRTVSKNEDIKKLMQESMEGFVAMQENKDVEEELLKDVYALGFYKYVIAEQDFIDRIIH